MLNVPKPTVLKDALYNLSPESGSDSQYANGLIVGVVSTLMSTGLDFEDALEICKHNCPSDIIPHAIPQIWLKEWEKL